MLQSKLFYKAKKTAPKDAEAISHQYLVRADFIEQSISGVYRFLPLGFRVLKNIEKIIREEMELLGGQEVYLPAFQNKSLWLETNRWETIDPPLFRIKDRHQKETALGSTHEEEMTDIFRRRIKSYQDLPAYLFQIQNKFRNEMRFSGGLMRVREFLMKDLYSFHRDEEDLSKFYEKVRKSYFRIFKRCGLEPVCVEASSGTIGGEMSHEFMIPSKIGEDRILACSKCGFAANIEKTGDVASCPKCKGQLEKMSCIEIGHIFNLGTKYTRAMKAEYQDKDGKNKFPLMGCYGIGLHRLVAAIVESSHDEKGIIWPESVAPFSVHLVQVESSPKVKKAASAIYADLQKQGIEVLYDDRGRSAGEKFAEADLIGLPLRMVVSDRTLKDSSVEIKRRDKKQSQMVKIKGIKKFLC